MFYLCSRRALSSDGKTFTARPGNQTTFLRMHHPHETMTPGYRIDSRVWAREVVQQSANNEVLLIIHGFRTPQNKFLNEVANVRIRLGTRYTGAVVGLDWPTNGRLFDYREDQRDAAATAPFLLKDCLNALFAARAKVKLHILGHSMGCFFIHEAIQSLLGTPLEGKLLNALKSVSVTGADVDQDWSQAHHEFTKGLKRTAGTFVVHYSNHDEVLHIAEDRYHNGVKRLGRDGLLGPGRSFQLGIDWSDYYRATYKNPFGIQQSHNFYYRDGRFYDQLLATLNGG